MSFNNEPLVVFYEAPDQFHSQLVKDAVENVGLPVIEQVDRTQAYDNVDFSTIGRYSRLLTLKSRAAEAGTVATEILTAFQSGGLALPEEEAEEAGD